VKYQLVLQFSSYSVAEDAAVALEEELTEVLGDSAYVDGHDFGSAQTSIFVFTDDPHLSFERVSEVIQRKDLLDCLTAAHRHSESDDYTVIWPENWRKEFKLDRD
jgi:hypothetical protein